MLEYSNLPFINEVGYIKCPLQLHRSLVSISLSYDSVIFTFESRISVRRCYPKYSSTHTHIYTEIGCIHAFNAFILSSLTLVDIF